MANAATFVKRSAGGARSQTEYEQAGLAWLSATGAPVVRVLDAGPGWLELEHLPSGHPSEEDAYEFGRNLAHMHAAGAPCYGAAPAHYDGQGWMGRAPLSLIPDPSAAQTTPLAASAPKAGSSNSSWGIFYSKMRIRPYVNDVYSPVDKTQINRLCELLEAGILDHPEPKLVRDAAAITGLHASRIHGDLWSGNIMWTPGGGVLIDPAAQGGHAEEDLAVLGVFGAPHRGTIVEGYLSASPLAEGWQSRVGLHQLHILLVHSYLFGHSYVADVMHRVNQILEENDDL